MQPDPPRQPFNLVMDSVSVYTLEVGRFDRIILAKKRNFENFVYILHNKQDPDAIV